MMEMKIKIEAPDLAAAISKLADAITPAFPDNLIPAAPVPAVEAPVAAPVAPVAPADPVTPPAAPAAPEPTVAAPAVPVAPAQPAPAATAPAAPAVPVAEAPTYTLQQISTAGAALVDMGKMEPLLALLAKYGVAAVTQLSPEQYGAFATELRGLGAQI